jgi:hypothetical protein
MTARRVQDHGRVSLVALDVVRLPRGFGEHLLELVGLDHDRLGGGPVSALHGFLGKSVPHEQVSSLGVREIEVHLALLQQHVHRYDDAAGAQDAVVEGSEVRHVRNHQSDAVARLKPSRPKEAGDTGRALIQHLVGDDHVIELQRGSASVPTCRVGQELDRPVAIVRSEPA